VTDLKSQVEALSAESRATILKFMHDLAALLVPPSDILPSEYAAKNIIITSGPRQGVFVPDPYQTEIMDTAADPRIRKVTALKSVQSGFSQIMLIIAQWMLDVHSAQIGYVFPNQHTAEEFAKDRLRKEISFNTSLAPQLVIATNRTAGTTTRTLRFRNGGLLYVPSAATPSELRSYSMSAMMLDELSGYEITKEGSAEILAEGRGDQWENFKLYQFSTPAKPKGFDPTENAYLQSSQALFHVPCPRCGWMQPLRLRDPDYGQYRLIFERQHGEIIRDSIHYVCEQCSGAIWERERVPMVNAGKWVHAFPDNWAHRGYRINALYPVGRGDQWHHFLQKFLQAKATPQDLRGFVNLWLGETFEENLSSIGFSFLRRRLEAYPRAVVPAKTAILIATVDVQKDRLECGVWAFGPKNEMWLVDLQVFYGDPTYEDVWGTLDGYLLEPMPHELTGEPIHIDVCGVDTGYDVPLKMTLDFIAERQADPNNPNWRPICPVYGLKGRAKINIRNKFVKRAYSKDARVRLYLVASNLVKTCALNALVAHTVEMETIVVEGGEVAYRPLGKQNMTSYVHLPIWMTDEQLKQLAAVSYRSETDVEGQPVFVWKERDRNEVWDLYYYAHAMLALAQEDLSNWFANLERAMAEKQRSRTIKRPIKVPERIVVDISDLEV
jgi:phage terminase large subunit GpA-like protein